MNPQSLSRLIRMCTMLVFLASILGCQKEEPIPIFIDYGNIGTQGGIIKTSDGASVEIPEGALSSSQNISVTNTTGKDTVANSGCKIYELKPDGLIFTDSVIITLPFDDTYLNVNTKDVNFGICIMVFQDLVWMKLKTKVNLEEKTATAKIKHFSKYAVSYPSKWSDYFDQNRNSSPVILNVPYYGQYNLNWCAFYSLSMITRYSGYYMKGPYFAALMNRDGSEGESIKDDYELDKKLNDINIETSLSYPSWSNMQDLCGYLIYNLKNDKPIKLMIPAIDHSVAVTGYDESGFYINDPGTAFIKRIDSQTGPENSATFHVPYDKFIDILNGSPFLPNTVSSMVINSTIDNPKDGVSINFNMNFQIEIENEIASNFGFLKFSGKDYKPDGYFLGNIYNNNSYDGTDIIKIRGILANSDLSNDILVNYHVKIDNTEAPGSPLEMKIPHRNSLTMPELFKFQLKNLKSGSHIIKVQITPPEQSDIIYDYWEFPITIKTEFIDLNGTVTDIDGNTYKTVQIGTQTWMAENLKTTKYRDGTSIPNVTDVFAWPALNTGAFCDYDNDPSFSTTYGKLYNYYAVTDPRSLCPIGWHVPSKDEWITLANYLGGQMVAGGKLKSITLWNSPNTGTNETGFAALPGGYRKLVCSGVGDLGFWWSSTGFTSGDSYSIGMQGGINNLILQYGDHNYWGLSVRCIKD